MLTYHPAFDVNHGIFRMAQLLDAHPLREMPWDMLRILDFYYLFPHLLGEVRLPKQMTKNKKRFAALASKYNRVPSPRLFLRQFRGIQEAAIRSLAAKGFVDADRFEGGVVVRTGRELPEPLTALIAGQPEIERSLALFLATELSRIPLTGDDGLKARTGLLEYRYDPD